MPALSHEARAGTAFPATTSCVEVDRLVRESTRRVARPRRSSSVRDCSSKSTAELARELAPQPEQPRVELVRLAWSELRALERGLVLGIGHLAVRSLRSARTHAAAPRASPSAMDGSTWSVKN